MSKYNLKRDEEISNSKHAQPLIFMHIIANSFNDSIPEINYGWDMSLTSNFLQQIDGSNQKKRVDTSNAIHTKSSYSWELKKLKKWEKEKPWLTMKYPKVRCYSVNDYPSVWNAQQQFRYFYVNKLPK